MGFVMSRRSMLASMGYAGAAGSLAANLLSVAKAADDEGESAICLSMVFSNPGKGKDRFDEEHYRTKHLPLLKGIYGNSVERIEFRTPHRLKVRSGSHGPSVAPPAPLVVAAVSLWIRDVKAFGEKTAASAAEVSKDLTEITEIQPVVQFDKVVMLMGDTRTSVEPDSDVMSYYFPTTEGATFDAKYYGEKVIPLMISLYGSKAIRRVEYTMGSTGQGGSKLPLLAASHFYIRDRAAWDAAGMKAFPQLRAEGPKYTTIRPVVADMQVDAAV